MDPAREKGPRKTFLKARMPIGAILVIALITAWMLPGGCPLTILTTNPKLDALTPAAGPVAGGTTVTLRGSGFGLNVGVLFGSRAAARVTRINDQLVEAVTPPGDVGVVDVTLVVEGGAAAVLPQAFEYQAPPVVTPPPEPQPEPPPPLAIDAVTPARGPEIGGTPVTITGSGFTDGMAVLFGGFLGQQIRVINPTTLSVVAPAEVPGKVDVVVRHPDGRTATRSQAFEFVAIEQAPPDVIAQLEAQFPGGPRVVSAVSTSNTSVVVTFSEPVDVQAADASNYSIVQANVNPEAGVLLVRSAALSPDQIQVTLTTFSQNELTYTLTVTGVRDLAGNPLAPPERGVNPAVTTFSGTAPAGAGVDTDGDGIADHIEQRGYIVTITRADGSVITRGVTSDPTRRDTDADGLDDAVEKRIGSDPRSSDSDADLVDDRTEFKVWFSSAVNQDTDGDGLADSSELAFGTSPTLADTDGDQFDDFDEIVRRSRNPRIADLPRVGVIVGDVHLTLDQRYTYVDQFQQNRSDTTQVSTTISRDQARSSSSSHTDSTISSWNASVTAGFGLTMEFGDISNFGSPEVTTETTGQVTAGGGMTFEDTWVTTESSSERSSEAFNSAVAQVTSFSSIGTTRRETVGAAVQGVVTIQTDSDVAFRVSDIEISALRIDPDNPQNFIPVATLRPADPDAVYNLGPLNRVRGPFVFTNSDVFPSLVEELMKNPRGLLFKVANFNITDEFGRNFAFSSQDVVERTAELTLDFGNGQRRNVRVATAGPFDADGRQLGITMEDALRAIGFAAYRDADGNLREDPELGNPDDPDDPRPKPTDPAILGTFGTRSIPTSDAPGAPTVRRITRVGGVQDDFHLLTPEPAKPNDGGFWAFFYTPAESDPERQIGTTDFEQIRLHAGERYTFAFVQDKDLDGIFSLEEVFSHSSDNDVDSDTSIGADGVLHGDGLVDYVEIRGAWDENGLGLWRVAPRQLSSGYRAFSNPSDADSDDDGLDDGVEYGLCTFDPNTPDLFVYGHDDPNAPGGVQWDRDIASLPDAFACHDDQGQPIEAGWYLQSRLDPQTLRPTLPANRAALDPRKADTDEDGVSDADEVRGYEVALFDRSVADRVFVRSNPLDPDTDGDGLIDGMERLFGTNPVMADSDAVFDDDLDGLPNRVETTGWDIEVRLAPGAQPAMTLTCSGPAEPRVEVTQAELIMTIGQDQLRLTLAGLRLRDVADLLVDFASNHGDAYQVTLHGVPVAPASRLLPLVPTQVCNPGPVVLIYNPPPTVETRTVQSDPDDFDTDQDGLPDYVEYVLGTDPASADTDDDGLTDWQEWDGTVSDTQADLLAFCDAAPNCQGYTLAPLPYGTEPANADTDGDGVADGTEVSGWTVQLDQQVPYAVTSDPRAADTDLDGMNDGLEYLGADRIPPGAQGDTQDATDPQNGDTDGDGTLDGTEILRVATLDLDGDGLPDRRNPLRPDQRVTIVFNELSVNQTIRDDPSGLFAMWRVLAGIELPRTSEIILWAMTDADEATVPQGCELWSDAPSQPASGGTTGFVMCSPGAVRWLRLNRGQYRWDPPCNAQSIILPYGELFSLKVVTYLHRDCNCEYYIGVIPNQDFIGPIETQTFEIQVRDSLDGTCDDRTDPIEYSIEGFLSVD